MNTEHTHAAALKIARKMGILRPRDLEACGIPRRYATLLYQAGEIQRIGRGLYVTPENTVTENHTLAFVGARAPHAVICLLTALRFHELTTQQPTATWIAVSPKSRPPRLPEVALKVVRFSGKALSEGVQEHVLEGVRVRITSPAKTVVDCFKYRNKIGRDVAVEALRDAMTQRKATLRELDRLARVCRVTTVIRPYLEFYL